MLLFACLFLVPVLSVYGQLPRVCHLGADIALVFDISSGRTDEEQLSLKSFGEKMVEMVADHALTQLAIISYDTEARERITLKEWGMSEAKEQIFNVFSFWDAGTPQTHRAMDLMNTQTFSMESGSRVGIANVSILLTDRPSSDPTEAARRAARLKDAGTIVYVLTIGDAVPSDESLNYATSPGHILNVPSYANLPVEFNTLKQLAFDCWPCPDGWISRGPNFPFCYLYVTDKLSWADARLNCMAEHNEADLIAFSSDDQVTWVWDEFVQSKPKQITWIGLKRLTVSDDFSYTDQTPLDTGIISWKTGNPAGTGLCVAYGVSGMVNKNCALTRKSVCALSKDKIP